MARRKFPLQLRRVYRSRSPVGKQWNLTSRGWILKLLGLVIVALGILFGVWVAAQQPVTLRLLMTAPDAAPWNQVMVREFEQQNPKIRVQIIEGPNATNLIEDLYTSAFLLGDSPYDLINLDVVWTPKFAAAGWLLDLTDRVSAEELQAFSTKDVEGGRYQERLYRIPVRSDVGVLYYRQDLLQQAGYAPPETFAELIKISQDLQNRELAPWGYVWQGRQYEGVVAMFVEVLEGFGGFWVNPQTLEVGLDRPEALQAVKWLRETVTSGVSPSGVTTYQEEETRRLFHAGNAVFLRSWPYLWPLANASDSPIRGKIGIKAMVHAPGESSAGCLGGWGLGISKTSKHPEAAWKAIQFFTSRAAQKDFILAAGYVPSRRDLFTDPDIVARYSHYPQLLEIVDQAVLRPPIAQYAQVSDILQRYLSAAFTDRLSPETAMQQAAAETRRLLRSNG